MTLTPGQRGDAPPAYGVRLWDRWLLERLGPVSGRPQLLADRADEGDAMRALAAELGWELASPPKAYRDRNTIERSFGRIKRLRGNDGRGMGMLEGCGSDGVWLRRMCAGTRC